MSQVLKDEWNKRPWWMQLMFLFCIYMTFIYSPWDIFTKSLSEDVDVWFGYMFTGVAAKIGATIHWVVYALGTWGFWKMSRWMHPWAAIYIFQIALSMALWGFLNDNVGSPSIWMAAVPLILFSLLAVSLLYRRDAFIGKEGASVEPESQT